MLDKREINGGFHVLVLTCAVKSARSPPLGLMHVGIWRSCRTMRASLFFIHASDFAEVVDEGVVGLVEGRDVEGRETAEEGAA